MGDFLAELKIQYEKERSRHDSGKEILETMTSDEAKNFLVPLFEARVKRKKELEKLYRQIKRIVKKFYAPGTFAYDFSIDVFWLLYGAKEDIKNQAQLDTLERYYLWNESRKSNFVPQLRYSWEKNTELIQLAKQTPIAKLYKNPLKRSGNRLIGLCPFHQERTPSFTIFTNSNTFFCFGCAAKGDVISFYQKLYGVSFWDAVKQLTGSN